MLTEKTYLKIMRASAMYDLIVTAPFMTPFTFTFAFGHLAALHGALGLAGVVPAPDVYTTFFASLMGTVVVIWSIVRLRLNLASLGRFDAAGRVLFSLWMIWALGQGASALLFGLLLPEMAWGVAQLLPYRKPG